MKSKVKLYLEWIGIVGREKDLLWQLKRNRRDMKRVAAQLDAYDDRMLRAKKAGEKVADAK